MKKRNAKKAAKVQETAEITGFSERYVYQVINGDRDNEQVMRTYMFLNEGVNKLVAAAKKAVEF